MPPTPRSLWTKRALAGVCAILICVVAYLVLQLGLAFTPDELVGASTPCVKPRPAPPPKPAPPANEAELEKVLLDSMRAVRDKLEAARQPIPDEQNSATVIARAAPLIPKTAINNSEYSIGANLRSPAIVLSDKHLAMIKEDVASAVDALALLEKLPDFSRGRYPLPAKLFDTTHLQECRRVAELLRWQAALHAHERAADAAVLSCRGALNAGRAVGDEPLLMAQLHRLACQGLTVLALERTLGQGTSSAKALTAAQTALEVEAAEPLFRTAIDGDRTLTLAAFAKIEELRLATIPARLLWFQAADDSIPLATVRSTHATVRRRTYALTQLAKRPANEWWDALAEEQDEYKKTTPFEQGILAAYYRVPRQFVRAQARLRCAIVGLAVERYRLAHQRWPDNLDQLRPAFLAEAPLDPFSGKALEYHRTDDGVVIFSVGPDDDSDLAKVLKRSTDRGRSADLMFQLWDPERRRQAAPPPKKLD